MRGRSEISKKKKKSSTKRKLSAKKTKTNKRRRTHTITRKKRKSGGGIDAGVIAAGAIAVGAIGLGIAYGKSPPNNKNYNFKSNSRNNYSIKNLQLETNSRLYPIHEGNKNSNKKYSATNVKLLNGSGSAYKNTDIDEKKKLSEIALYLSNHVKDPNINREEGLDIHNMLSVIKEEGVHKNNNLWENLKLNIKPIKSKKEHKVELTLKDLKNNIKSLKEINALETGNMNTNYLEAASNRNCEQVNKKLQEVDAKYLQNTSFKRASKPVSRRGKFNLFLTR